jgi:hypothetical protein
MGLICGSFILLLVDIALEPELARIWKVGGGAIIVAGAVAFSWAIVFVQAPVGVVATVTNAEYPPDATISGVPWKKEFTELQMRVINPSDKNYDDVRLLIRPTEAIASIQQIVTNVPGVYFTEDLYLCFR